MSMPNALRALLLEAGYTAAEIEAATVTERSRRIYKPGEGVVEADRGDLTVHMPAVRMALRLTSWSHAHDFGLKDEKGRAVGIRTRLTLYSYEPETADRVAVARWWALDDEPKLEKHDGGVILHPHDREQALRPETRILKVQGTERPKAQIVVTSHATRDGDAFGASTRDIEVGDPLDPATPAKARKALLQRVEGARKRYAKKYG